MREKALLQALKELFYHVADACDGGERMPSHVIAAYNEALKKPCVSKFYCDSINRLNSFN